MTEQGKICWEKEPSKHALYSGHIYFGLRIRIGCSSPAQVVYFLSIDENCPLRVLGSLDLSLEPIFSRT